MASNYPVNPRPDTIIELPYEFESPADRVSRYGVFPVYLQKEAEPLFDHFVENYIVDAYLNQRKDRRACAYQIRHGVLVRIRCPDWWGRTTRNGRLPTPLVTVLFSAPDDPDLPRNLEVHIKDESVDNFFNEKLEEMLGHFLGSKVKSF
ncbi:uncharacterized protein LOC135205230 [Macrobrachium nipponense]|uniref:uncharacterized protein LOC135205230 n=1 Tax=Macrobrachium nipponense TaxID=159736 RepID=UPI0030C8B700